MVRARVAFIHPAIPARFNGAPMGLLSVATVAKQQGHEVALFRFSSE
jgi:hypothetical protein